MRDQNYTGGNVNKLEVDVKSVEECQARTHARTGACVRALSLIHI